jgi:hypothetical protein
MAKKRKAAGNKRPSRKRSRRRASADSTVNTLVILVVIVIVLGGLYLYAQNKKQAALFPDLTPAIAAIMAPFTSGQIATPSAVAPSPEPAALTQPPPVIRAPEPTAGPDGRQPVAYIEAK